MHRTERVSERMQGELIGKELMGEFQRHTIGRVWRKTSMDAEERWGT